MVTVILVAIGTAAATWLIGGLSTPRPARSSASERPAVSVVVPARNESATLPTLFGSLVRLDPGPLEIIVVDDESDDGTADIARAHGAVVVTTSPPPGWLGKPWACHVGAEAATGGLLVFLDADTCLAPDALGTLIAEHAAHGGLVSVQPYHVTVRPYEELSAYCSAVAMLGSGAFAIAGPSPTAVAFGPCLVTSAGDYERAGGHGAVRAEVLEDIHLARRYQAAGLAVTCLAGGDRIRFRMYPGGLRQLVDGWGKNIAAGASAASPVAVVATVVWVAAHAAVAVAAIGGVVGWLAGGGDPPLVPALCWLLVAVHQRWLLGRIGSFRWPTAIVFPVPLAAFIVIFARSLFMTGLRRQVTWRGRRIDLRMRDDR